MRKPMVGTGWKMNHGAEQARRYAAELRTALAGADFDARALELFVLPPFVALPAAVEAFAGSAVAVGAQNMHWDAAGAWTGEVSAPMLREAGCRYVELAHSERLWHFGETYAQVARKLDTAFGHGLVPILCLGETAEEKDSGRADEVLAWQIRTALAGQDASRAAEVVYAYEPRWAIGTAEAASPDYVAERHGRIRALIGREWGAPAADAARVIYGGSVNPDNGPALIALADVDGLFIGRAAWTAAGFFTLVRIVAQARLAARGAVAA